MTAAPSPRAERPTFGDTLGAAAEALGLQLSGAQVGQLLDFVALLDRWNRTYNLTAVRDPAEMLTQHVIDCLAAVPALRRTLPGPKRAARRRQRRRLARRRLGGGRAASST